MRIEQTEHFEHEGFSGDTYVANDQRKGFNALRVVVNGVHPRKRMVDTTRVYFVCEGTGTFTHNGNTAQVAQHDCYVIEPGDEYEYEGNMILFEFNISPANTFKDEVV